MIRVQPLDSPGRVANEALYDGKKRGKGTIRFHHDAQPVALMDHPAAARA